MEYQRDMHILREMMFMWGGGGIRDKTKVHILLKIKDVSENKRCSSPSRIMVKQDCHFMSSPHHW